MICQKGSLDETAVLKTQRWKVERAAVTLNTGGNAAQDRGGDTASAVIPASPYLGAFGVECC